MGKQQIDIITLELINNFLYSLVDEMTQAVIRTSFSPITRASFDFQCGLCLANGEMVLEGEGTLIHSLIYPTLISNLLEKHGSSINPGDIFVTNDPYSQAAHLPDIFMMRPVFINGNELAAWSVAGGHLRDVGGSTPGSCACDSTEIYQEGLILPPVKLYDKGKRNDYLYDIIKANSRAPAIVAGDIDAFRAACFVGEGRFLELVSTYGWESLRLYLEELLDYAERLTRAEISELPDGEYEFTDYLDDGGFDPDPVPIHCKITVSGDMLTYDFNGTSPQVRGALNNPLGTTRATVVSCLRYMINPEIPRNSGVFRPIKLIVPEGTLLNPRHPGAVSSRGATIGREVDTIFGAQSQIAPDKIMACASQCDTLLNIGGHDNNGKSFILMETFWGGWGGRPFADGLDYNTVPFMNGSNQPCELNEEDYPIVYNQHAYAPDTEGPGKYRGSVAVIREWQYVGNEPAIMQLRVERQKFPPYGLYGGQPGTPLVATINPDTENRSIGKITMELKKNDVLRLISTGAGGWGPPLERDVNTVLEDTRSEKISVKRAKEAYGVLVNENTMEVDIAATERLRKSMKESKDNA